MLAFHPFTKSDWFTYAGAECFLDTAASDPLIAEIAVNAVAGEFEARGLNPAEMPADKTGFFVVGTVIVDAGGASVSFDDNDGAHIEVNFRGAFGTRAVALLRDGLTLNQIVGLPGAEVSE